MATKIVTKSGSGAPTASDLVAGELAVDLTNGRLYTEDSGGTVLELGLNPSGNVDVTGTVTATGTSVFASLDISGDIDVDGTTNLDVVDIDGAVDFGSTTAHAGNATFADNAKAIFGAGSDLQVYHDGSHSYVSDQGTGDLRILAADFRVRNAADDETMIQANADADVSLWYNNSKKLATTGTGIDVTGTVTADGLDLAAGSAISSAGGLVVTIDDDNSSGSTYFEINANGTDKSIARFVENGDISFYEDTGTTPKFFWDASAESLGIGTDSPSAKLDVIGAVSLTDSTYSIYSTSAAATIGHVGNTANDLNIYSSATGHNGLRFHISGILPTDNTGGIIDADADLGVSAYRFKDLYLSGGVYLGGTGAANKLDDYEEGTWQPVYTSTTDATDNVDNSIVGYYTKTGNTVYVTATLTGNDLSGITSTDQVRIAGLPFTSSNTASANGHAVTVGQYRYLLTTNHTLIIDNNVSHIAVTTDGFNAATYANFFQYLNSTATSIKLSAVYQV